MSSIRNRRAPFFALLLFVVFTAALPPAHPQTPLSPRAALLRSAAGSILFTRYEVIASPVAGVQPVPVPKIYSMTADRRSQRPFIAPAGDVGVIEARQPAFSPDYKSVLFSA
jgi:hypothetical protein